MDYEKLIEQLRSEAATFRPDSFAQTMLLDAAHALSALWSENKKLRKMYQQEKAVCHATQAELEQVKREMDTAVEDLRVCSTENRMECQYCLYRTARSFCWDCTDGSNWHWRGQKED